MAETMWSRLLAFVLPATVVREDGAPDTGPLIWIRASNGTLTQGHVIDPRVYAFTISGQRYEHAAVAEDGTWIYEARP